jgi:predicted metal-dependent hydrolase
MSPLPPYTLRRSARARRLRVTVDPVHGLIVTVPPATRRGWAHPEREIERFLREREGWVRRHLTGHARQRAELAARGGLRDGATIRFRGELHALRIVPAGAGSRRSTVTREGGDSGDALVVRSATADRRPIAAVLDAWFRERARLVIDDEIANHATALGVSPKAVSVRDQRSRWGSASRHARLSFSWRLVLAPPEALETVVIHELAHLRVFGHGPAFWALVAGRRPDHLTWRKWLRTHSVELHSALDENEDQPADRASA